MIKRKSGIEAKVEKPKKAKPKKSKVKFAELADAIVDGKFVVPVGGKVFFERRLDGRAAAVHEGIVKHLDLDGRVEVWDETREQLFCFSLNQTLPVIKAG